MSLPRKNNSDGPSKRSSSKLLKEQILDSPSENIKFITKVIPSIKYDDDLNVKFEREDDILNNFVYVGGPKKMPQENKLFLNKNPQNLRNIEIDVHAANESLDNKRPRQNSSQIYILGNDKDEFLDEQSDEEVQQIVKENTKVNYNIDITPLKNKSIAELTRSLIKEEEATPLEKELEFVGEFIKNETEYENEHMTSELFRTIQVDEIIAFIFAFTGVGSAMVYHELKTNGSTYASSEEILNYGIITSILIVSISVFFFCKIIIYHLVLTGILRYINWMKLYKSAKYISSRDSFFESDLWKEALFEFLLAIIHPNYYAHCKYIKLNLVYTYTTNAYWNLMAIEYNDNDFLTLILLFRIFYFFRMLICVTKFYGDRADRVA